MNLKIYQPLPPEALQDLERCPLNYSTATTLYHVICIDSGHWCGVFGDGENAAYEWFVWHKGAVETSDCGYGVSLDALRDVLSKVVSAPPALTMPASAGEGGNVYI